MALTSKTMLVLARNFTLSSAKGHAVTFVKDVPTHVPPSIYQEAMAIGAIPPEGDAPFHEERAKTDAAPVDPTERAPLILSVVELLADENLSTNFTAAGVPSVDAVTKLVGFKVQSKEIAQVWQMYHDKINAAKG